MKEMKRRAVVHLTSEQIIAERFIKNVQHQLGIEVAQILPAHGAIGCCARENLEVLRLVVERAYVEDWPDGSDSPDDYYHEDEEVFETSNDLLSENTKIPGINVRVYFCRDCRRSYTEDQAVLLPQN